MNEVQVGLPDSELQSFLKEHFVIMTPQEIETYRKQYNLLSAVERQEILGKHHSVPLHIVMVGGGLGLSVAMLILGIRGTLENFAGGSAD